MNWHQRHKSELSLGQRAADTMRNSMGSWPFVFSFMVFMGIWGAINMVGVMGLHWDPYPFILLNLLLSTLAGLQGAILLIAAKRADQISAALAQNDFDINRKAEKEIEINTAMTLEIRDLTKAIHAHVTGGKVEELAS